MRSIFHDQLTAILKNAEITGKNKDSHSFGLNEAFLNLSEVNQVLHRSDYCI